jgi:hypothetical protein
VSLKPLLLGSEEFDKYLGLATGKFVHRIPECW